MRKLHTHENGFSVTEIAMAILAAIILGLLGWLVYKTESSHAFHDNQTSASPSVQWKTFSNGHVSFKYPSGWEIDDESGINGGQYSILVSAISPYQKPTVAMTDQYDDKITSASISFSIQSMQVDEDPGSALISNPNDPARLCQSPEQSLKNAYTQAGGCEVSNIVPLKNNNDVAAKLLIVGNPASPLDVSDSPTVVIGSDNYQEGLYMNRNPIEISGGISYKHAVTTDCNDPANEKQCQVGSTNDPSTELSLSSASNIKKYETTSPFKEFIESLNSVSVQ